MESYSCEYIQLMSPNNRMQRGGMDKVLRRGQDSIARKIFTSARVREALCPRADANVGRACPARSSEGANGIA
jgi:hypothetical protein